MTLLKPEQLHAYQRQAVAHMWAYPWSMLWLQMGLGKTAVTLTSIVQRMKYGQVNKTLIFGPLRVVQTVWEREARKWEHTQHLTFSVMCGTKQDRERALFRDADIYLTNYENMNWLAQELDHYYIGNDDVLPFQMVVYDEISKLANSTALRMKGGNRDKVDRRGDMHKVKIIGWRKMVDQFKYRVGLTGTPASNGYLDLFGQFLAVDGGERLGQYVTGYRDAYFQSDYMGWSYKPTEIGKQYIESKISDITLKMDAKDYLDLPAVKVTDLMVDLPDAARRAYIEMEKKMFAELDSGAAIEVFSQNSISNKLLQFCNGSPFLNSGTDEYEALHDAKLDALEDVLEEAGGSPVLCSYTFKPDAERIMKRFKKYKPVNLTEVRSKDTGKLVQDWIDGKIKLLVGHPQCLHPLTKVLTERHGWVRIIDVKDDDRVFDGVEFVSHDGCMYSGYKEVTDVFGITMTPDHKLLIGDEWVEAKDVESIENAREKASYKRQVDDTCVGGMSKLRSPIRDGGTECGQFTVREEHETSGRDSTRKAHVYDLVNCGPRNRFLVKNDDDEMFISHNSMGHGIDGLQESGNIVVWFGCNWSLQLYEQMNARIDRQGQKKAVSIIRILCADTVDMAVADALERKTDEQESLKAAIQRYRAKMQHGEISFL